MHNSFGQNIKIEIYGGSHTKTLGIKVYGLPKDFTIELSEFEFDLSRRRPGALGTTNRMEADSPWLIWNNDNLQIEFLNEVVKSKNKENNVTKIDVTKIYEEEFAGSANETAYCTPYTLLRLFADKISIIPDKILYLDIDIICDDNERDFIYLV